MQSLLHYNTFGIDQACRQLLEPTTVDEIKDLLSCLRNEPLLIIGGGSNLLLTKDFDGNVLHLLIKGIEVQHNTNDNETVLLRCGAGEVWDDVIAYAVKHGYYGMENMSMIPGEIGASAVQNVGAYGKEAKDIIYKVETVEIATGNEVTFSNSDCCYAYRYSRFKADWKGKYIVTYVTYCLHKTFIPYLDYGNLRTFLACKNILAPTANDVREAVIAIREEKLPDPKIEGNAGSFFMNPIVCKAKFEALLKQFPNMPYYVVGEQYKIPAGWMIEQCGWKGKTLGRAGVHSRQALVLVNKGGASGEDILNLCNAICADVQRVFGIEIHPEVNII